MTKLEKLEKENQELKEKVKILKELNDIDKKFAGLATKAVLENNKLKKVIKILRYQHIHMGLFILSKDVNEYNEFISKSTDYYDLTQEKYELLKEVLVNA